MLLLLLLLFLLDYFHHIDSKGRAPSHKDNLRVIPISNATQQAKITEIDYLSLPLHNKEL